MTFAVLGRDQRNGQIGEALATASVDAGRVTPWARNVVPHYRNRAAIVMADARRLPSWPTACSTFLRRVLH